MPKGKISKKYVGSKSVRKDVYEYTKRNQMTKAEMNLDKIFISKFKNIRIYEICEQLGINKDKASALNLNARDIHRIKVELDKRIRAMYDIKNYEGYDLSKRYLYQRWDKATNKSIEDGKTILLRESYADTLTDAEWNDILKATS